MVAILIGSTSYDSYASVDTADDYLNAASHGATWRALSDNDDKARYLVTATRLLDRQYWKGTKTSSSQALDWPRSNTGIDGVTDSVIPTDIINASIELALALLDGSEVQNEQTTEQKIQNLKAGSVSLTFFRGADGTPTRFPQIVQELLRDYLAGPGANLTSVATGVSGETISNDDYGYTEGI